MAPRDIIVRGSPQASKLNLICTQNSIPIGFKVSIGSVHDVEMSTPLFKDNLSALRRVKIEEYLIGDTTYDSIRTMEKAG